MIADAAKELGQAVAEYDADEKIADADIEDDDEFWRSTELPGVRGALGLVKVLFTLLRKFIHGRRSGGDEFGEADAHVLVRVESTARHAAA
jgi:hypothetical protein